MLAGVCEHAQASCKLLVCRTAVLPQHVEVSDPEKS